MEPDRTAAEQFLAALDPTAKRWTFQTLDDSKERREERKARGERTDPFAQIIHGTLKGHWRDLVKLNAQGAGIFVTINETDFKGRTAENIKKLRALFADLDGSPLDPVIADGALPPHIITETSPGRWHVYWRVEGFMGELYLEDFTPLQKSIAARFGGDPTVHDLPRVMRLPGFFHWKGEPFLSRIVQINSTIPEYCGPAVFAAFPFLAEDEPGSAWTASGQSKKASRWGELNERALKAENLPRWVPQIFPTAMRTRHGGYRVASADLGRGFEEDLSIDPRGIKYFGIADMGDKRQGRRTPIELVTEFQQVEAPQAADWLEKTLGGNGHDAESLPPPPPEPEPQKESATDTDVEITRLAKLSLVDYEQQRKGAAEKLGVRASILDRLVRDERAKLGLDEGDALQGREVSFPEPEPWPEPVDGAALLDTIAAAIRRHVVMPDHARDAAALWVVHTFLTDRFLVSPRLGIRSPTKGCGKTLLLDVLGRLVLRPLSTANVTAAAIFRVVEAHRPTLLVDEADTFLRESDELRGVLNSGHRRGGSVLRTVGDDHEPRAFGTYSPCAIALIGHLPDTLHDRAVAVDLKRRLPSETVEPFRPDRAGHLDVLARRAARWAKDHGDRVGEVDPEMPAGIVNRAADNWRPLLAIAEVAAREWPQRAREAAAAYQGAAGDDDGSLLELLLGDIRDIFDGKDIRDDSKDTQADMLAGKAVTELPSADLVDRLVKLEGRPWAEFGRHDKPLTQNMLARLLKPAHIKPGKIGPETARKNGYIREHFKEAFDRYLGAPQVDIRTECDEMGTSELFKVDSESDGCPLSKSKKPNNDAVLSTCPLAKGETGGAERYPLVCEHCGAPEQPGNPVQRCAVDGLTHLLHRHCQAEWLGEGTPEPAPPSREASPPASDPWDIPDWLHRAPT